MTKVNEQRRWFLTVATSFVAGAGLVGGATPLVQTWNPSARAKAAGAPVKLDPEKIEPGAMMTVEWQGKPVWILRRTPDNLKILTEKSHRTELRDPDSEVNQQPSYAKNDFRRAVAGAECNT